MTRQIIYITLLIWAILPGCSKKNSSAHPSPTATPPVIKKAGQAENPFLSLGPSKVGIHDKSAYHVGFSPNGKLLASTGQDKLIKIWDAENLTLLKSLPGHQDKVMMAAFSPDSKLLVSTSTDLTARIWDLGSGKSLQILKDKPPAKMTEEEELAYHQMPPAHMNWAAFSPDGKQVITASDDFSLKIWDVSTGKKIKHFKDDGCRQRSVYRRTDASGWASSAGCMDDGVTYLKFWDEEGNLIGVYGDEVRDAHYLAFDQRGKYIIAADGSLAFSVFSAQGSFLKRVLVGGYHFCLHFGMDDKYLLVGTHKGEILVYRPESWTRAGKLELGEKVAVDAIDVHPIDGRICAALRNGSIVVFPKPVLPE